jgi:hypothetical protein
MYILHYVVQYIHTYVQCTYIHSTLCFLPLTWTFSWDFDSTPSRLIACLPNALNFKGNSWADRLGAGRKSHAPPPEPLNHINIMSLIMPILQYCKTNLRAPITYIHSHSTVYILFNTCCFHFYFRFRILQGNIFIKLL